MHSIPTRIIDELMGHRAGRSGAEHGSAVGASYRHTTPEIEARIRAAVQERLRLVLQLDATQVALAAFPA